MDFNILVGTMTGTAELVAEEIDIYLNDINLNNFNENDKIKNYCKIDEIKYLISYL